MKVLLLIDRMEVGGAETHLEQLALGLQSMGVEVTLLSAGGCIADRLERAGIRQLRLPLDRRAPWQLLMLRLRLRGIVKRGGYDILHAHARFPAFLMRGLGKYGAREMVTVHAKFALSPLLRCLSHWGSYTVAVSEDLRHYVMQNYSIPAEQVTVIPNGIDLCRFSPLPEKRTSGSLRVLFASRLDRDCSRGAELLCRVAPALAQAFPALTVTIVGGGDAREALSEQIEAANRAIGRPCIQATGQVEDMALLLRQQDIFVGVSRAAMEAAACGCAVILCGNEGYLGILQAETQTAALYSNFCARGCEKPTAERLKNDLMHLLDDPKTRTRCAKEGLDAVRAHLSGEEMCRRTLALYHRAARTQPKRRILVGGYVGCGNIGDDAILQGFLEGLHEVAPEIHVTALSGRGRRDSRRFRIPCIRRKAPLSVIHALLRADAFLCGGGSLLQNGTSNRSLFYYLLLLTLARLLGAPPVLYAAGIGPLYGKSAKKRTRHALKRLSYLSLRDPESLFFLERMGVERAHLHLGADPTLLMPLPPPSRTAALLYQAGLSPEAHYLCVILRGGRMHEDTARQLLAAARMLSRRHGLALLFLLLDTKSDHRTTAMAAKRLGGTLILPREPADAVAILRAADLTLSMRLHGLIFATLAGTPCIGLPSDPSDEKIRFFARLSAQEVILPQELTVALAVERSEGLLQNAAHLKPLFAEAVAELRKKAKKDLANIATMLYNNSKNTTKREDME